MTLAVHPETFSLARDHFGAMAGTVRMVSRELSRRRSIPDASSGIAARALENMDWLGVPDEATDPLEIDEIVRVQGLVSGGRGLIHPSQHLGEATLIVVAKRGGDVVVTNDYDARIIANAEGVTARSIPRLLHEMIRSGAIDADYAESYCREVRNAHRGPDITAAELRIGGRKAIGRLWEP